MIPTLSRLRNIFSPRRAQAVLFSAVALPTALCILPGQPGNSLPVPTGRPSASVSFTGFLAQTKLPQGGDGKVAVEFTIATPGKEMARESVRRPSDIIVVLDRSPSMQVDNRLPYAVKAVESLLDRMADTDRIGFISFDSSAILHTDLAPATAAIRAAVREQLHSLPSAGGTNIGAGLELARSILDRFPSENPRRVILLSDGEANTGITDMASFASLSQSIVQRRAVVSTIGLGLGFNEALMSALADHGMGNYSYLEHLASLGTVLEKDLRDVRSQYASESTLELILPSGAWIADAAGFPFVQNGNSYKIATGQLLAGAKRSFFVTFAVPTGSIGTVSPLRASFQYRTGEGIATAPLSGTELALAVVPSMNVAEIRASTKTDVFTRAWTQNELGVARRKVAAALRAGNKEEAKAAISSYRADLGKAQADSNVPLDREELRQVVTGVDGAIDDAFVGPASQALEKQNRAAKANLSSSLSDQRK